ncbi:MAG: hypothetical protein ACTHU0_30890 [Kofleriaceae bacterium]
MRASLGAVHDMVVLARLHATLDTVVETEATIRDLGASSPVGAQQAIRRLGDLMGEARELLRGLLADPARRPAR